MPRRRASASARVVAKARLAEALELLRLAVVEAVLHGPPVATPRFAHIQRAELGRALEAVVSTEAAAATAVMVGRGMANSVVADHPFFFAITHGDSSTILFMGAIYNPHNKIKR